MNCALLVAQLETRYDKEAYFRNVNDEEKSKSLMTLKPGESISDVADWDSNGYVENWYRHLEFKK